MTDVHQMPTPWRQHCNGMATTWQDHPKQQHGSTGMATKRQHGNDIAPAPKRHSTGVANTWQWRGNEMTTTSISGESRRPEKSPPRGPISGAPRAAIPDHARCVLQATTIGWKGFQRLILIKAVWLKVSDRVYLWGGGGENKRETLMQDGHERRLLRHVGSNALAN